MIKDILNLYGTELASAFFYTVIAIAAFYVIMIIITAFRK